MTQNEPLDDTLPIPGPASQEIGANNPPSAIKMARDQWKAINVFLTDHPAIVGEDDARQAKLFLDRGMAALADLEAARKAEADPPYNLWTAINARFKPAREAIEKLVGTKPAGLLRQRLTDYALAEEARRLAEAAEARRVAEEAERIAREAEAREKEALDNAAVGEVVDVGAATQEADAAFDAFKAADRQADRAERDSHIRIGGGFTRAAGLRNKSVYEVVDAAKALAAVGCTDKIRDAILSAARDYERLHGKVPDGVTKTMERSL